LLLKNVHLLSPPAQEQFLTTLEQTTDPLDSNGPIAARLISTAAEPLEPFGTRREFNAALYYRLSVYRVSLPLLRERAADIPDLFEQMVRRVANGNGAPVVPLRLTDVLAAYDWPGNLRELQNVARTYVVTGDAEEIVTELSSRMREVRLEAPVAAPASGAKLSLKQQVKGASQKLESEIILQTLERHRWNRRRAAESLQISYRSLLYKMKNCNLRMEPRAAQEGE
jgi:DNA-binding NtrC family response regulator